MYSTSFDDDDNRYIIVCIANETSVAVVDTIVDTGAMRTCYMASDIDPDLTEDQVSNNPQKTILGFTDVESPENGILFYQYPVKQFTIGNIDLGKQDIWITFDERISDNLLGLDILQHITFLQIADSHKLSFFEDMDDFNKYVSDLQESSTEK